MELSTASQARSLVNLENLLFAIHDCQIQVERPTHNYKVGDIVLLKDELLFNRNWPLARVTKIYPGDDGLTRTVDLFCQGKIFRRATNRLILIVEDQPFPPSMSRSDTGVSRVGIRGT